MIIEFIANNPVRLAIASVLSIVIVDNSFIFLSLWSLVHLLFGGLITYILFKIKTQKEFILIYLFLILFSYEVIEYILYNNLPSLFLPETFLDVVWDLIIGVLGGILVFLKKRGGKNVN